MAQGEPWRRFEAKVDPEGVLPEPERVRRARISYGAFMRANAKKAAKVRAANQKRRDATRQRRLAKAPTEKELADFRRERDDFIRAQIIWAAAQRGESGIEELRKRQLKVRPDCLLCRRPFDMPAPEGNSDVWRTGSPG